MSADDTESRRKRPRLEAPEPEPEASLADTTHAQVLEEPVFAPTTQFPVETAAVATRPELSQEDRERAVGVSVYVSPHTPGFNCTVKQRFTDFLVNEILPGGETLRLVDFGRVERKRNKNSSLKSSSNGEVRGVEGDGWDARIVDDSTAKPEPEASLSTGYEDQGRSSGRDVTEVNGEHQAIVQPDENLGTGTATPAADEDEISYGEKKKQVLSDISDADRTELANIFGTVVAERILGFYAATLIYPERKAREHGKIKTEVIDEKTKRTAAHVAVRRIFKSKLETVTLPEEQGVILVRVAQPNGNANARAQLNGKSAAANNEPFQKARQNWEKLGGEYLHFTLYKENKDTMEVLYFLASQLKVPAKSFQFAGTKDRRGVTVQRIAIHRILAERIAKLNQTAKGWRVGGFEYRPDGLDLGELGGNEFMLTLRDCSFGEQWSSLPIHERLQQAKKLVRESTAAFQQSGFINYFGLQRFGTFSTGTHIVGMKMLQGDLEGAVDSILSYSDTLLPENQSAHNPTKMPQDDVDRAVAIRTWRRTGVANEAIALMPRRFQAEAAMIKYLSRRDKSGRKIQDRDFQGALMQIQRQLRSMYLHAYQSVVWNTAAAKRWELYGPRVMEGDLVVVGEKDDASQDKSTAQDDIDADGEVVVHPAPADRAATLQETITRARPLSRAEAESGRFDVFDIVLPLPGHDVLYPTNASADIYTSFMSSEAGGKLDPYNMRRTWRDISLPGDYRKILARPEVVSVDVRAYKDPDEQMVSTDLEKLEGRDTTLAGIDDAGRRAEEQEEEEEEDESDRVAVLLRMRLGRSQYATMALRELTKGGAVNFRPQFSVTK